MLSVSKKALTLSFQLKFSTIAGQYISKASETEKI